MLANIINRCKLHWEMEKMFQTVILAIMYFVLRFSLFGKTWYQAVVVLVLHKIREYQ